MNTQPNTSTLKGKIAVMQALADGKRVQQNQRNRDWWDTHSQGDHFLWNWVEYNYRIHPDDLNPPVWRPWKRDEVPTEARFRVKGWENYWSKLLGMTPTHVDLLYGSDTTSTRQFSFKELFDGFEYSLDGKTWQICGVKA